MASNNDPFNREFNKRETKRRTIKSWLFLGFIFLVCFIFFFSLTSFSSSNSVSNLNTSIIYNKIILLEKKKVHNILWSLT